jgi:hypothetical protein
LFSLNQDSCLSWPCFFMKQSWTTFVLTFLLTLRHTELNFSPTNNFVHAQTLSRMSTLSGRMNIARVNIGFFTGFKKIKQRRISFVLGYLRMILWEISTLISIKHRILATIEQKHWRILYTNATKRRIQQALRKN